MNDSEKVRILSAGLRAACRWLYQWQEMHNHIKNGVPPDQNFDDGYIADVASIRKALEVTA